MDYLQTFALSAAGMTVERARVEAAALNLAHANTVLQPGKPGWQPTRVAARVAPGAAFVDLVAAGRAALPLPQATQHPVAAVVRLVHEPGHPLADAQGYVTYAGVDPAAEMVSLMGAMRAYEANLAAFSTARALALKTLEIGRGA